MLGPLLGGGAGAAAVTGIVGAGAAGAVVAAVEEGVGAVLNAGGLDPLPAVAVTEDATAARCPFSFRFPLVDTEIYSGAKLILERSLEA